MATWRLLFFGALSALLAPSAAGGTGDFSAPAVEVTVGVLLPGRNQRHPYPGAWPRVGPALSLAREALGRHAGLTVRTAFKEEDCAFDGKVAAFPPQQEQTADLQRFLDADVLLGLRCPETGDEVALFAQPPLLSAGTPNFPWRGVSDTTVYAGPAGLDRSAFEAQLLRHFNGTSRPVVVIGPEVDWGYYASLLSFEAHLSDTSGLHRYEEPGDEAVRFIRANGRVVYVLGSLEMLQEIMRLAQAQNMTNGDYVFIYVDFFGESLRAEGHREAAKPWQSKESRDMGGLREAFQTVLVVTYHGTQTPEYRRFQSHLILRAQRDSGVALNDSLEGTLVAGCFHDVLLLYLRALSETLREGGTKEDTSRILEKMRGLKIQGVTGTVSIDSNNSREMDFDLWAMRNVESEEYQVVAQYVGSEKQIKWLDNSTCVFNKDDPSCGKDARPPAVRFSGASTDPPRMDGDDPPPRQLTARYSERRRASVETVEFLLY